MFSLRQTLISGFIALSAIPMVSATGSMTMSLAPHCTETDRSLCPSFEVTSPTAVSTGKLTAGDILDIDIIVSGPEYRDVRSVRSWLKYDPEKLEGRSVELTHAVTSPTPGEQTIDPVTKSVKIGGGVDNGFASGTTVIARVTFRVLSTTDNTEISFFDFRNDGMGHTAVNGPRVSNASEGSLSEPPCFDAIIGCKGTPKPLLSVAPGILTVRLKDESAVSSAQSDVSSAMSSSSVSDGSTMSSSASSLAGEGSTFTILQVQGVKVTTRDTSVFLGWNDLKSSALTGYNVYYGTVSGRYIQRRSIPATEASLVLRDLQIGTTYYFAVRGVNAQNQETVFSQEVSVTVGKPETATSPFTGSLQDITGLPTGGSKPSNITQNLGGKMIGGNTGVSDTFFLLFGISAVIGTFFAFKRQLALSHVG